MISKDRSITGSTRVALLAGFALCLGSCNPAENTSASSKTGAVLPVRVPLAVQQALNAKFTIDGDVHWLSKVGQIQVRPKTRFCRVDGGISIDSDFSILERLHQIDKSDFKGFRMRFRGTPSSERWDDCRSGSPIFSQDIYRNDESHKLYSTVVAIWQCQPDGRLSTLVAGIGRKFVFEDENTWKDLPYQMGGPKPGLAISEARKKLDAAIVETIVEENVKRHAQ